MTCQPSSAIATTESPHPGIRTQDIVAQRSAGINHILEIIKNGFGRHIQIRGNLVAHNFAFAFKLGIRKLRSRHQIYKQIQRTACIAMRKGRVYNGVFFCGESIQLATHSFHTIDDMPRTTATRAFEYGMLHKVRQSALAGNEILVTTAGIDNKTTMSYGTAFKVQMHNAQAVIKGMVCRFDHIYL